MQIRHPACLTALAFVLLAACAPKPAGTGVTPDAPASEPAAPEPRADLPPFGEPPVWTVSDADTTVHLFGTVHILKPETEWQTPALLAALDGADAVYFEADVTSPESAAQMARLVPQLGLITDGSKLTDLLDEAQLKEVSEAAEIVGLPVAAIEPMKPWLATVQMSVLALQKQGYAADAGVESVLTNLAGERGVPLRFLETAEKQLRFFADMPMEDQIDFLVTSAEQIEDDPNMLDELVLEWSEGDIDDLAEIMAAPDVMGNEHVYATLIVERNANWVDQIQALMDAEAGTFLIAVGAAHLAGEDSVVEMLRAEGLEVAGP